MSRIIEATCSAAGIVSADGYSVTDAEILSEGKKQSEGILLLDGDLKKYFPSSATDIKDLITALVQIITQTQTIMTGLDAATTTPGAQTSAIAQLGLLKTQLEQSKEMLK